MRTPGHDRELAAGFLVGEGILRSLDQIEAVHARGPRYGEEGFQHSVRVTLRPGIDLDLARLERNCYTTSSCGVCGKTSLEALELNFMRPLPARDWQMDREAICALPARLRESQAVFDETGGLHAAGLFMPGGKAVIVREDVGRHNAVDKVIGFTTLAGGLPAELGELLAGWVLMVSGRVSFEIVQKAAQAGIGTIAAVSAPTSLAVSAAERLGVALAAFVRGDSYNVYSHPERLDG